MTKNKGGRPTKYDPSYIDDVDDYLSMCGREQTTLPTKYGFAEYLQVDDTTLDEWEKKHPEFSLAIKRVMNAQREQLMNDGLYGGKEVNAAMAIFLLKVNHNMIEINRQELTGKDGKDLPTPILGNVSSNNGNQETPTTE